jgi:hypothetical protein
LTDLLLFLCRYHKGQLSHILQNALQYGQQHEKAHEAGRDEPEFLLVSDQWANFGMEKANERTLQKATRGINCA